MGDELVTISTEHPKNYDVKKENAQQAYGSAAILTIPVFVINLPRDVERCDSTLASLATVGIAPRVWEACDGATLSRHHVKTIARHSLLTEGRGLSRGEIGCAENHSSVYEHIVKQDISLALVLEDDVQVGTAFVDVVQFLIACGNRYAGLEFDLVNFITDAEQQRVARIGGSHHLTTFREPANRTSCYLIAHKGAAALLASGRPIRYPTDGLTGRTRLTGIDSKGIEPPVASLADFPSTIQGKSRWREGLSPEWLVRLCQLLRRGLTRLGMR